nr:hypothetical protein K-LCC10_0479 [Kaumoebavirus]
MAGKMQRKVVDPELIATLDERVPREITDIIISHLLETPREVVKIWNGCIEEIIWSDDCKIEDDENEMVTNARFIRYKCKVEHFVTLCKDCGKICMIDYWTNANTPGITDYGIQCCPRWNIMPGRHPCGDSKYEYMSNQWKPTYRLPIISPDKMVLYELDHNLKIDRKYEI